MFVDISTAEHFLGFTSSAKRPGVIGILHEPFILPLGQRFGGFTVIFEHHNGITKFVGSEILQMLGVSW